MNKCATLFVVLFVVVLVFEIKYSSIDKKIRPETKQQPIQVEIELSPEKQGPTSSVEIVTPSSRQISCNRSHNDYDICTIHVATVMDPTTSTFFIQHPIPNNPNSMVQKIRPHPKKYDKPLMSKIKELTITSNTPIPSCHISHESPALVFNGGGYTGNFFHDFDDGLIPLFITLHSIFHHHNKNVVLVISDARKWWPWKYKNLLDQFTNHPIIDLDDENTTHCFPHATLGLISHGLMTINPKLMPNSESLYNFHEILIKAYGGNNVSLPPPPPPQNYTKPRLVFVNRSIGNGCGRLLLNFEEVKLEAEKIGFDVIVFEPKFISYQLTKAFSVISTSHVMVGIHGAGLTHFLFLKPGRSLLIQLVPFGAEWVSEMCFGKPAREMGLDYMEYRIGVKENTLIEKYGKEHLMIKDPLAFLKGQNWSLDIYLKEQDVRLDLVRFREYLKKAYGKARQFMTK